VLAWCAAAGAPNGFLHRRLCSQRSRAQPCLRLLCSAPSGGESMQGPQEVLGLVTAACHHPVCPGASMEQIAHLTVTRLDSSSRSCTTRRGGWPARWSSSSRWASRYASAHRVGASLVTSSRPADAGLSTLCDGSDIAYHHAKRASCSWCATLVAAAAGRPSQLLMPI
jgi:hypothetical protein